MIIEPERTVEIEMEHNDGVHEGETMKMASYCADCFDIFDEAYESMKYEMKMRGEWPVTMG